VSWTRVAAESGLQTEDLPGWLVEGETVEEKEVRNRVGLGVALPLANRRLGLGLSGWYDHRGTPDGDPNQGGNIAVSAAANLADEHLLMSVQGVNLLPWRMYYNPIQVTAGLRLRDAVAVLESRRLSELPVVDADGRPLGLLDIVDLVGLVPSEPATVITGDTADDTLPLPGTAAA
jgi:hypothetical protein